MTAPNQALQALASIDVQKLQKDPVGRYQVLSALQNLRTELETPWDAVIRMNWIELPTVTYLKVALDIDLFTKFPSDCPQSAQQIAQTTNTDPALLTRILRFLVAVGILKQDPYTNHYIPTTFSNSLIDLEGPRSAITHYFDVVQPVSAEIPRFLARTNYTNPSGPHGPWQAATGVNESFFEWMKTNPAKGKDFNLLMAGYTAQRRKWTDLLPAEYLKSLVDSAKQGETLLVDVGGGMGPDTEAFRQATGATMGLVLQDQPEVIAQSQSIGLNSAITGMPYDFFTPQPVTGSKLYFMHNVLHDWPDAQVILILKNVRSAMTPGYSRFLLNEPALHDGKNHPLGTSADLYMMAIFCAKERTRADWDRIMAEVGLSIVKVWSIPEVPESLIEVERVGE